MIEQTWWSTPNSVVYLTNGRILLIVILLLVWLVFVGVTMYHLGKFNGR